ncbi:MAG: adenylate/guanylate cyclase domain-containing protein [Verrucomicrobiota bacterium]|jgi:adenylate cyclase
MSKPARERLSLARRLKSKWTGPVVGTILTVAIGLLLLKSAFGQKLIFMSYDLPFIFRPTIYPQDVVLVYLDDTSYKALDQSETVPLDRRFQAKLIRRMTRERAKAVVFDIVFSDPSPDTNIDNEFIQAVKENGRVILSADKVPPTQNAPGISGVSQFVPPFDALGEVAAAVGSDQMPVDDDLMCRQHLPVMKDDAYKSVSWTTASFLGVPITKDESQWYHPRWFNYYGPDKGIPFLSYYQALEVDANFPEGYFSNKVVFVGARTLTKNFGERKDEYPAPFPNQNLENKFMPGVEIHATAFLNLLRGDWLNRFSPSAERYDIVLLGLLIGAGLALLRPFAAVRMAVFSVVAVALVDYILFLYFHYWFPWLIVALAQIPVAAVWSVSFNTVQLYVEKQKIEQSLSLYLSPKLVKKFAKDPTLLKPGAEKQMLTILFSDIAGFTSISEGMDPDELARLMNAYFQSAVSHCIFETDGTVVKYIGDAIFAFWNAPEPQGDHAFLACDAALRFRALPAQIANGRELVTRIGLHTGVANVGNFGSDRRVDYTAIGENINLASRMEGLNKYLGTSVLITADTQREVGPRLITRFLGLYRLKGFERAIGVYELVARPDQEAESRPLRDSFALALDQFTKKDFAAAEASFRRVLDINGGDGPSKFYLEQITELRAAELPPDWKGEITLKDK